MLRPPQHGERILVLRKPWLDMILSGEKTVEVRSRRVTPGDCLLGCRGRIYGRVHLGLPIELTDPFVWEQHRIHHRCEGACRTPRSFGMPLSNVMAFLEHVPYTHPRGAIGFVRYRG